MHIADNLASQDSYYLLCICEFTFLDNTVNFLHAFIYFTPLLLFIYDFCDMYWTHLQSLIIFFCFYVLFLIFGFNTLFLGKPVKWTLMRIARICLVGMGLTSFSASELALLTFLGSADAWRVPGVTVQSLRREEYFQHLSNHLQSQTTGALFWSSYFIFRSTKIRVLFYDQVVESLLFYFTGLNSIPRQDFYFLHTCKLFKGPREILDLWKILELC